MISVVVPAYNEAALLGTTVRDMVDGLRALDLEFELHIVENGSTDGTPAVATRIAEALAEVEVHSMRTANYGEALRTGLAVQARIGVNPFKYGVVGSSDTHNAGAPYEEQFYFGKIEGEKYLRYCPNAKHNLAGTDARESLTAFYESVLHGGRRPVFSWTKQKDGSLLVRVKDRPSEVNLWQATNPKAREIQPAALIYNDLVDNVTRSGIVERLYK